MNKTRKNKSKIKLKEPFQFSPVITEYLREGLIIAVCTLAIFCEVILLTYNKNDSSWTCAHSIVSIKNWGGKLGAWLANVLFLSVGYAALFLPVLSVFMIYRNWRKLLMFNQVNVSNKRYTHLIKSIGLIFLLLSSCGLLATYKQLFGQNLPAEAGGIVGDIICNYLTDKLSFFGRDLLLWSGFLIGLTFTLEIAVLTLLVRLLKQLKTSLSVNCNFLRKRKQLQNTSPAKISAWNDEKVMLYTQKSTLGVSAPVVPSVDKINAKPQTTFAVTPQTLGVPVKREQLPDLGLLRMPVKTITKPSLSLPFHEFSRLIEQRLLEFGVAAKVSNFYPGPVITRFELALAPGVKVNKITVLSKDIARSLSVASVRVVEVIPGKDVIGLEVANQNRESVILSEILSSPQYNNISSPVALGLGKDIAGVPVVVDLAKMPHLLAAGTTGSGKSVSLNVMLLSMLYKSTPEELRFILIDPKMLELSIYAGIPHLLTPVITDMSEATNALRWCVAEMDKRYKLMSYFGVRNLASYNEKINSSIQNNTPLTPPEWLQSQADGEPVTLQALPLIVVVVDELADLIMVVGKKIEELLVRLAQKARAAGMHLILATQRPSVDVITGLIKANVPTRIAFQVSSRIDSRTILDQQGAEQLLGHGDMLYLPAGAGIPTRIHGAYVSDEEVHQVVAAWQNLRQPEYISDIINLATEEEADECVTAPQEHDPLYDQAVFIVTESRRASTSLIQRRLRIGYNRAARLMEYMEAAGIVTASDSSGNRQILVSSPPPIK